MGSFETSDLLNIYRLRSPSAIMMHDGNESFAYCTVLIFSFSVVSPVRDSTVWVHRLKNSQKLMTSFLIMIITQMLSCFDYIYYAHVITGIVDVICYVLDRFIFSSVAW